MVIKMNGENLIDKFSHIISNIYLHILRVNKLESIIWKEFMSQNEFL